MYTEKELDSLIRESIKKVNDSPYVSQFSSTDSGFQRIFDRVKQHILVRGIENVDTAIALVESELSQPNLND